MAFLCIFSRYLLFYSFFTETSSCSQKIRFHLFLCFFHKASGWFVGLVIVSALVNLLFSNSIYKKSKIWKNLDFGFEYNFQSSTTLYYKYTNFFITLSNEIFSTEFHPLNIILPIGISFFTFENLSYTIDVYRGDFKPANKFTDYLLFLSFFPKLMMGPIVRAHDFVPQINKPYILSERDFAMGFYLIISGLIKKLVISDYITLNLVNYIFDTPSLHTGLENLFAVYGYAMVIYCDFSGYSDIAIGIALWLGFKIPANFMSPYQSKNITEFWRRWHISFVLVEGLLVHSFGWKQKIFHCFLYFRNRIFGRSCF
jgi:D-alanyl-lipoteichoic acid acyltransferase DltB (MBOAT superfamily)